MLAQAIPLLWAVAWLVPVRQAVPDTGLPTGAHVRIWSHEIAAQGWQEGTVVRFTPAGASTCVMVHVPNTQGSRSIQHIDSLKVAVATPAGAATGASTPTPRWRSVPVGVLRAREHGCG